MLQQFQPKQGVDTGMSEEIFVKELSPTMRDYPVFVTSALFKSEAFEELRLMTRHFEKVCALIPSLIVLATQNLKEFASIPLDNKRDYLSNMRFPCFESKACFIESRLHEK